MRMKPVYTVLLPAEKLRKGMVIRVEPGRPRNPICHPSFVPEPMKGGWYEIALEGHRPKWKVEKFGWYKDLYSNENDFMCLTDPNELFTVRLDSLPPDEVN